MVTKWDNSQNGSFTKGWFGLHVEMLDISYLRSLNSKILWRVLHIDAYSCVQGQWFQRLLYTFRVKISFCTHLWRVQHSSSHAAISRKKSEHNSTWIAAEHDSQLLRSFKEYLAETHVSVQQTKYSWCESMLDQPEVRANSTALLQSLCEHFVLSDVVIRDWTTSEFHRLLEVITSDLGDWVVVIVLP